MYIKQSYSYTIPCIEYYPTEAEMLEDNTPTHAIDLWCSQEGGRWYIQYRYDGETKWEMEVYDVRTGIENVHTMMSLAITIGDVEPHQYVDLLNAAFHGGV